MIKITLNGYVDIMIEAYHELCFDGNGTFKTAKWKQGEADEKKIKIFTFYGWENTNASRNLAEYAKRGIIPGKLDTQNHYGMEWQLVSVCPC